MQHVSQDFLSVEDNIGNDIPIDRNNINNLNKRTYYYVRMLINFTPSIAFSLTLANTILTYFYIDLYVLSAIGGLSFLSLFFLYLSSSVFSFSTYNKIFIHYNTIILILGMFDYYWGIPLNNKDLFITHMSITGLALFLFFFLITKKKKNNLVIPQKKHYFTKKELYKYEILAIKTIPMATAVIYVVGSIFSFYDIDLPILSFIGGMPLLIIILMYLTSFTFKFCVYHRIFIHYIAICWLYNTIDIGTELFVNIQLRVVSLLFYIFTGITFFSALFLKLKK